MMVRYLFNRRANAGIQRLTDTPHGISWPRPRAVAVAHETPRRLP